jgi:hypothetical protein
MAAKKVLAQIINHWGMDKSISVLLGTGATTLIAAFILALALPNDPMEVIEIIQNNKEEF